MLLFPKEMREIEIEREREREPEIKSWGCEGKTK